MRSLLALIALTVVVAAGCSTTPPTGKWQKTGAVEIKLASTWPPRFDGAFVSEGGLRSRGSFLLDTGTEDTAIDEHRVDALDLSRTWPPRFLMVQGLAVDQGGVGERLATERQLPALELAGVRLENLHVVPLPLPAGLDGALGLAAFPGRALVLDPVHESVSFVPRSDVDALLGAEGVVRIPAKRDGNLLVATIGLTGKNGATAPLDVVFDTGAQDSFVSPEMLKSLPPPLAGVGELADIAGDEIEFDITLGNLNVGPRAMRVDRRDRFCTLGGGVLLALGRPVLFDLEGGRLALLATASAAR